MRSIPSAAALLVLVFATSRASAPAEWVPLGPVAEQTAEEIELGTDGGPVLYALLGSGVVRSTDGGATWTLGGEGLTGDLRPFLLRADPHRAGVLYSVVNGVGVYRSFDRGTHWHPAANVGLPARARIRVSALAVHPIEPSTLLLGTSTDWIFVSEDGGETWRPAATAPADRAVHDLAIDPLHPHTIYVAASGIDEFGPGAFPAAYKSVDGGASWRELRVSPPLDEAFPTAIVVAPGEPGAVYMASDSGGVIRSTDGGTSWTRAETGLPEGDLGITVDALALDPAAPSTLYASTESHGEMPDGVFRTTDGAGHWDPVGIWTTSRSARDLEVDPGDPSLVFAAPGPFLSPSSEGGPWRPRRPVAPPPLQFLTPHPTEPQVLYLSSLASGLRRSIDGGTTWEPFGPAPPGQPHPGLVVDPTDPETLYLLGFDLLKSTDGGLTWQPRGGDVLLTGLSDLLVDPRDPATLYGLDAGRLFRSADGGESWTFLAGPGAAVRTLALHPTDPTALYAGTGVGGPLAIPGDPEGFCRSDDQGESWTCPPTGLPRGEVTAVAVDPADPSRIYLSLDGIPAAGQVRRSLDGGATWAPASDGLPDVAILDLAIDPGAPGTVWAATRGRGVFRSADGGTSWVPASPGLGLLSVEELSFGPGGLYAATSRGAFHFDPSVEVGQPLPPEETPWLVDPGQPGFRFKVRIDQGNGTTVPGAKEAFCLPETLCVSGAIPGRSEVFLRIVGPKPNGWLWPTLVKFTTSRVEVWIHQTSSGRLRYYDLRGASPGFDELPGLFDRFGFVPE